MVLKVTNKVFQHNWKILGLWLDLRKCSKSTFDHSDLTEALIELCQKRHFVSGDNITQDILINGHFNYGHLGMELKRNLATNWWGLMVLSREQVFGVQSPHQLKGNQNYDNGSMKLVDVAALQALLNKKDVNKDILKGHIILRPNLLQGAIRAYIKSLNLVNRKLPFGLAEIGVCYQPFPVSKCSAVCHVLRSAEVELASLVWFSSPRTSGHWLDYWVRQRLMWWRKFAKSPSSFTASDSQDQDGIKGTMLYFKFPWGKEPIETLVNLEDSSLVREHHGNKSSLQLTEKVDSKLSINKKKVLKLHPFLAPFKVALDMGKGPTVELRQVCEVLFRELSERRITVWPGYLETMHMSLEQLSVRYDEMGVIFSIVINETTLENGLVQLRNRDTTMKEMVHISEVRDFLTKYIQKS
ncbi:DNA polymerase subunit gamma-2 isoform X2 [Narcine bancroftii]|uniref:DNA polymerase subunit gamma-2 isoform X2 n=1 Tax=Narcine bancroftii TaxID=1343680 RepID=UPI0038320E28